jgi:hypothetical protein
MLKLDQNSENTEVGRPFVKMSANWDVVGTCRTRTSPMAAFPHKVEVDLNMLRALVLNGVGGEVNGADIVAVDECTLHRWSMELLK